ncbi:hypothetical protein WR25_02918 [Diploscapter pachys]|uniref:Uncharacterized protein n=1 Tax=Diploscapter pachys TaxID=2018661 RepID=A0A2A2JG53_9BILA|nr:hypothetical protein WR25_02918 [Diploscapter pachys]
MMDQIKGGSVDGGQSSSTNMEIISKFVWKLSLTFLIIQSTQACIRTVPGGEADVCSCARNIQTLDFAWETRNAANCNGFDLNILTLSEPTITIDGSDGVNCNIEMTCPATATGLSAVIRAGATEVCGPIPSPLVIQNQGACSADEQIVAIACYTLN